MTFTNEYDVRDWITHTLSLLVQEVLASNLEVGMKLK